MHSVGAWQRRLAIRQDNGSQYTSDAFQDELRLLAESNGCAERFIRTLKRQLPWARTTSTAEEPRWALLEWAHRYNEH